MAKKEKEMTFTQLMNNIKSIEADINRKMEAVRVLADNQCFEEAEVMAARLKHRTDNLETLFDDFDYENAEFE